MTNWKTLKVPNEPVIKIVAASYLNNNPSRFELTKSFIHSIKAQTYKNYKLIVVHDGPIENEYIKNKFHSFKDSNIEMYETPERVDKYGYPHRKKYAFMDQNFDWLLYTNDDNYYVPVAMEAMLFTGITYNSSIVYCNMISSHSMWLPLITEFKAEKLDLGGFIMSKEIGKKYNFDLSGDCFLSDAKLIERISSNKESIKKVNNFLYIHN